MGTRAPVKRPFCLSCSKPARTCLCARIKTPLLENSIAITILQHSQEKTHPLNSTRIANLGLKNLTVAIVSDVHLEAQFHIHLLKPNSQNLSENDFTQTPISSKTNFLDLEVDEKYGKSGSLDLEISQNHLRNETDSNPVSASSIVKDARSNTQVAIGHLTGLLESDNRSEAASVVDTEPDITASIAKWGFTFLDKPDFDQFLVSQVGKDAISNGFFVKKLQKKQLNGSKEFEFHEEFEILIPPGSALLFPTMESIGLEDVDFEVKHLIVLDGTWAKAKRMYHENPWLKVLPHLKLDPSTMSLYSEVRHQPRAGCLSTIESIVFALKGLGEKHEGLDDLLTVFESMVGDQRRFKDERLSKIFPV